MPPHADAPLRSWSFPIRILPGELLSSWLSRSAHLHGIAPYAFLSIRFPGVRIWDRDVDRGDTPRLLDDLDQSAGLQPGRAAIASLSSWVGVLATSAANGGNVDSRPAHVPFLLSAGIHHRTRRLHGLQFCPVCLREGEPRFERIGRLAFVVGCPRHGSAMLDACPSCDAPVIFHRAPVGRLAACHACGSDLGRGPSGALSSGDLAAAVLFQDLCLGALDMPEGPTAVPGTTGREFLSLARVVTKVVAGATPSDAGSMTGRRQVELMRLAARVKLLGRVGRVLADWPSSFRSAAPGLGLHRITFDRLLLPSCLAAEVALLPSGSGRRRAAWRSVVDTVAMRRLRRADPAAYRSARARRLLAASAA